MLVFGVRRCSVSVAGLYCGLDERAAGERGLSRAAGTAAVPALSEETSLASDLGNGSPVRLRGGLDPFLVRAESIRRPVLLRSPYGAAAGIVVRR